MTVRQISMTPKSNQPAHQSRGDSQPSARKIAQLRDAIAAHTAKNSDGSAFIDHELEEAKPPVRKKALGLLNYRARSTQELRGKLLDAEFEAEVIDEVIADLEHSELLNDEKFAHEWVHQRHQRRGKTRLVLDHELADKGIAPGIRAQALEQIDDDDEAALAEILARKKAKKVKRVEDRAAYDKELRKIVGVLARRGFGQGMALGVARQALDKRCDELGTEVR